MNLQQQQIYKNLEKTTKIPPGGSCGPMRMKTFRPLQENIKQFVKSAKSVIDTLFQTQFQNSKLKKVK